MVVFLGLFAIIPLSSDELQLINQLQIQKILGIIICSYIESCFSA
jgi:hypothetical protein